MEKEIFLKRIKVRIGEREFDIPLLEQLEINMADINTELAEQPGKYAYWAALSIASEQEYNEIELALKKLRAEKYKLLKEQAIDDKKSKITEAYLEHALILDDEVYNLTKKLIEKEKEMNLLKAIRNAFEQRKDSLIAISSNIRIERDAELRFKNLK